MRRPFLTFLLLVACVFVLTGFMLRADALRGRDKSKSALAVIFGDGRRLFANHFLSKADAYFHRGRYPSVFEMAEREEGNHLVESMEDKPAGVTAEHDHEDEHLSESGEEAEHDLAHEDLDDHADPAPGPDDWISRLAKRFEPDKHVHLEGEGEKEMLPWIRLAVEMDPHNVEAYTVGGYWLRQMGKLPEAVSFLREGQRNNPDSPEIYFELGRLYEFDGKNPALIIRLYQLSLEKWQRANQGQAEPNTLELAQILGRLAKEQESQGDLEEALLTYKLLQTVSPVPESVGRLIDSVQAKIASRPTSLEAR